MPFIDVPDSGGDNMERAFALRPEVYASWRQLVTAVKATSDERRYELATLAAARRLRSSYCSLAHGKVLAATIRCFFSKTLDALGVQPDAEFGQLDRAFREALTVGRPIEGE